MSGGFSELLLQRMDVADEVEIETRSDRGETHSVTIWIVVVDGAPYIRSVRGKKGRWYRELLARGNGAIHLGTRRVTVAPVEVRSVPVIDQVSAAFWRKYPKNASLFSMLRLATLHTTLRLEAAG